MKAAGAFMALASVITVVVLVLAVSRTQDNLIRNMRDCVQRGDATLVHGASNLGAARSDIAAQAVTRVRTLHRGGDTVMILRGPRFRLLVLANAKSPTLAGDLPKRLYEHADAYPLVAVEFDPVQGTLAGCAGISAG